MVNNDTSTGDTLREPTARERSLILRERRANRYRIIHRLRQQGNGIGAIARELYVDKKTVRRVLNRTGKKALYRPSKLEPFLPLVRKLVLEDGHTAQAALGEIRKAGYTGSYSILKEFVRTIRPKAGYWCIPALTDEERTTLLRWRRSRLRRDWEMAVTILENSNLTLEQISAKIERPVDVLKGWLRGFRAKGLAGLGAQPKKRVRSKRQAAALVKRRRLLDMLHDRPASFGINRASWTATALATAYRKKYDEGASRTGVGDTLNKAGYSVKKARRVLTSPDPEYREKVELVIDTLQSLGPNELFFFIDELGPLRVKKHGGRILAAKGDVPTVPQVQTHRGSLTMAGALSATTNQVTWLFTPAKDTRSMIDLIEILFNQHPMVTRIYLTWDAASWHASDSLVEWLNLFNTQTTEDDLGPIIQLVPLPTSSQFLNVIEAVFSGMKRAVIHHSDYQSVTDMKTAISGHFVERNVFFKENPKRAGKKIWDVDFFQDTHNLRSGDYREW